MFAFKKIPKKFRLGNENEVKSSHTYLLGKSTKGEYVWLHIEWTGKYMWRLFLEWGTLKRSWPETFPHKSSHLGTNLASVYLEESTLTDDESWELAELVESFLRLSGAAQTLANGNSGVSDRTKVELKDVSLASFINSYLHDLNIAIKELFMRESHLPKEEVCGDDVCVEYVMDKLNTFDTWWLKMPALVRDICVSIGFV